MPHKKRNILIVDDTQEDIALLTNYIQQISDEYSYNVFGATNREEAMVYYAQNPIDCAFVDFYMPAENGAELTEFLYNLPSHRQSYTKLPVVIMSSAHDVAGLPIDEDLKHSTSICSKKELNSPFKLRVIIDKITPANY